VLPTSPPDLSLYIAPLRATAKLALPPISQVQARGTDDNSHWYQTQYPTPTTAAHQTHSSVGSSPRADSFSTGSIANQSYDSNTTYTSPVDAGKHTTGLQTPSPEQASYPSQYAPTGYQYSQGYSSMNQPQAYMEHAPASAPGSYSYGQPQALQPASQGYPPNSYGGYQYSSSMAPSHAVTSSMGSGMVPQALPLPTMASSGPPGSIGGQQHFQAHVPDTSGQVAPPGMKPRVTATLWEDEGSLCFQVEAKGVCVARREDNHMINGTKLLNVAGMTRGRRDGILKSEKTRHVVKIGPMHLKGVW
jgi:protein SOK2